MTTPGSLSHVDIYFTVKGAVTVYARASWFTLAPLDVRPRLLTVFQSARPNVGGTGHPHIVILIQYIHAFL